MNNRQRVGKRALSGTLALEIGAVNGDGRNDLAAVLQGGICKQLSGAIKGSMGGGQGREILP